MALAPSLIPQLVLRTFDSKWARLFRCQSFYCILFLLNTTKQINDNVGFLELFGPKKRIWGLHGSQRSLRRLCRAGVGSKIPAAVLEPTDTCKRQHAWLWNWSQSRSFFLGKPYTTMTGMLCVPDPGLPIKNFRVTELKTQPALALVVGADVLLSSLMRT